MFCFRFLFAYLRRSMYFLLRTRYLVRVRVVVVGRTKNDVKRVTAGMLPFKIVGALPIATFQDLETRFFQNR